MAKSGPIIIVEKWLEDQEILKVLNDLMVTNEQLFFTTAQSAMDYLMVTEKQPFLIVGDINLVYERASGVQERQSMRMSISELKTDPLFS